MARSGCASVELGTDAGASATLAALGKSFTPDEIRAASAACREAGLKTCHSLILGGPGETWETLAETVRVIEECRPTAVVAMLGVRLYRDTDLARRAEAEGMLKREDIAEFRLRFGALMQFQAQRAHRLYDEALALLPAADRRAQKPGLMMASIYRALLREIERDDFRVLHQRVSLTPLRKLWLAWKVQALGRL